MKVSNLLEVVRNVICGFIMIIKDLGRMCRVERWKYDISHTSHIYNIHQLMSSTTCGKRIHKVENSCKKMRRAKGLFLLKGFDIDYRDCIENNTMVGERNRREPEDKS